MSATVLLERSAVLDISARLGTLPGMQSHLAALALQDDLKTTYHRQSIILLDYMPAHRADLKAGADRSCVQPVQSLLNFSTDARDLSDAPSTQIKTHGGGSDEESIDGTRFYSARRRLHEPCTECVK